MWTISRTFSVPFGHRLSKHSGLCKNIHGHNFKIKIGVSRSKLNNNGMVMDFSDLKTLMNSYLSSYFDHALILNSQSNEDLKIAEGLKEFKVRFFDGEPTAEAVSSFIYKTLRLDLFQIDKELKVEYVTVWENDESEATFSEPGL